MSLKDSVKSVLRGLTDDLKALATDVRHSFRRNNERMVDRFLDSLIHAENAHSTFVSGIFGMFGQAFRRTCNVFRSWRTTFTGKWRWKTGEWLKKRGTVVTWMWICTFHNSRDSHMDMHLQRRKQGTPFVSGAGNLLRYPGDRSAPVEEWINCQCFLMKDSEERR